MAYKLSEGSLEIIMSGGPYDNPVLQVLGNIKIQGKGEEKTRLLVSDGKHSHNLALLSSQLNKKVLSGDLSKFSVIKVDKYFTSSITNKENRRVMVILELTNIVPGSQVGKHLGNPQSWTEDMVKQEYASAAKPAPTPMSSLSSTTAGINLNSSVLTSQMTHPIASLSPYQNKWVIKVRVMNKTAIRIRSNAKGEGTLFSMDLCDESGEIRATAFNNECDKFYDMIQIDKVYYISRCALKTANKQFTTLKNDYEMTFTADTVVSECMDEDNSVPNVKYDFVPITDIANKSPDTILDVIGVCKSASDIQELTAKSTGKLLKKREITLVDSSGGAITLTLWGNEAEKFEGSNNPVVAVKGARLVEFNGSKSLSCLSSSMVRLEPDAPDAHRLRGWYDNGGDSMQLVHISARFVDSEPRSRASPEQFEALLEFMESHGDLARPQQGAQGLKADRLWQELGSLLNAMGGGVVQPVEKWKKVWVDWKAKTKEKALQKRRELSGTGGGPSSRLAISTTELRVLGVPVLNAVVGNSMIEEAGFDEPLNNTMPPPTQNSIPIEFPSQNSGGNLEQITFTPSPSSIQTVSPPPPISTPSPFPLSDPPSRSAPRRRRCPTSPSLAVSPAASTPQRRRLRRIQMPFERATERFVGLEHRRLQLEEEREKNFHQREMERLRFESRRLDREEENRQCSNRVESLLTAILTQLSKRP